MVWKLLEIGYNFYFQVECLDGVTRDKIHRTLNKLVSMDNPLEYEDLLSKCPKNERMIVKVIDSDFLLGLILHDEHDSVYKNCIELVKVINPKEIDF